MYAANWDSDCRQENTPRFPQRYRGRRKHRAPERPLAQNKSVEEMNQWHCSTLCNQEWNGKVCVSLVCFVVQGHFYFVICVLCFALSLLRYCIEWHSFPSHSLGKSTVCIWTMFGICSKYDMKQIWFLDNRAGCGRVFNGHAFCKGLVPWSGFSSQCLPCAPAFFFHPDVFFLHLYSCWRLRQSQKVVKLCVQTSSKLGAMCKSFEEPYSCVNYNW